MIKLLQQYKAINIKSAGWDNLVLLKLYNKNAFMLIKLGCYSSIKEIVSLSGFCVVLVDVVFIPFYLIVNIIFNKLK